MDIQGIFYRIKNITSFLIRKLFWLFELFLFLRLLLKFFNANPYTPVVTWVYKFSDIFVAPFNYIFSNIHWKNHLIDLITVSAILGYALVIFVIFELLKAFSRDQ